MEWTKMGVEKGMNEQNLSGKMDESKTTKAEKWWREQKWVKKGMKWGKLVEKEWNKHTKKEWKKEWIKQDMGVGEKKDPPQYEWKENEKK